MGDPSFHGWKQPTAATFAWIAEHNGMRALKRNCGAIGQTRNIKSNCEKVGSSLSASWPLREK